MGHEMLLYLVRDFAYAETGLVEDGQDTFVRLFYEVTDHFVVEVVDMLPLDTFPHVLLLFLF